ncbi:MAG TPA: hypothetical protein VGQ04_05465 [Chitinophagaceae bacterium]|nr:hypothetical protein [Chitinophagaceae bacterium]
MGMFKGLEKYPCGYLETTVWLSAFKNENRSRIKAACDMENLPFIIQRAN